MGSICFVNGSPRGINSCSGMFVDIISNMLDKDKFDISKVCVTESLNKNSQNKDFTQLLKADSIVFVFPLYIDAIPSNMLDYLYQFDEYIGSVKSEGKCPRVYAVINNGFLEGSQNLNATRIIMHFSERVGFAWRFGIGIGAGEFLRETQQNIPLKSKLKLKIYAALENLVNDLNNNDASQHEDIYTNPTMPKSLFMMVGNKHWTSVSKKSKKELSKRPF